MMLILTIILMTMIPEESKHLVPWKMGEEGFVLGEGRAKQFHRLDRNCQNVRKLVSKKLLKKKNPDGAKQFYRLDRNCQNVSKKLLKKKNPDGAKQFYRLDRNKFDLVWDFGRKKWRILENCQNVKRIG